VEFSSNWAFPDPSTEFTIPQQDVDIRRYIGYLEKEQISNGK